MARYLITGGAGFIGSNIAEELARRGEEVIVLDDLSTGRASNLDAFLAALHYPGTDLHCVTGCNIRNFRILFDFNQ